MLLPSPTCPSKLRPQQRNVAFALRERRLGEVVAELTLENRLLKKSVTGDGEDGE